MIIVLVAAWLGFLSLLVHFRILKGWALWMKISPVVVFLTCQFCLLIPMSIGAPAGTGVYMKNTIKIVPAVTGEVTDVPIEDGIDLQKGDVLFTVDPAPYQAEVNRLEAALKEAQQDAKMLPTDLAAAPAEIKQSEAALAAAKNQAESLEVSVNAANSSVSLRQAQFELSESEIQRAKKLFASKATTQADLDAEQQSFSTAKARLEEANAELKLAQLALNSTINGVNTVVIQAEESM